MSSTIDISHEELSILDKMYRESRHDPNRPESFYDVVCLPVVDRSTPWTDGKQKQFETLQIMMPWYSVHHHSLLDPAVIKNQNALHMMWIWGSLAFPFTSIREEALWKEETWSLELLVDGIDQNILNWISEGRLICLYGEEDMEWIHDINLFGFVIKLKW